MLTQAILSPDSSLLMLNTNRIIHLHPLPEVLALGDEFQMNGVNLVSIVGSSVGENERQRKIVRMVNDGPARVGRNADVSRRKVINTPQGF